MGQAGGRSQDDGYVSDSEIDEESKNNLHSHHPSIVDEDYLVVGNFIEDHIRQQILNGEYVDFARLLPRDRLAFEEDNRMEIVNKNG